MSERNRYDKFYMSVGNKHYFSSYLIILCEKIFLRNQYYYIESNTFFEKKSIIHAESKQQSF